MKVEAILKNLRVSPRKVRLVVNLIKGMDANEALVQLPYTGKKSNREIGKLLKSAIANAENNFGLDVKNLFVSDIQVGEGPTLKRWLPRAFGRATQLMKRTSNIYLILEEKIESKPGKRKVVKKKQTKEEKEIENIEEEKSEIKEEKKAPIKSNSFRGVVNKGQKSGWSKKVFQRKSA
ncbi:MAG: 50S ribosomal protein L22 [uncultured bacterium]|nr:MAG: 50S ribosomal protein L22 [uncultured bacterium]HBR71857.1 50S ribosomal protein L22 [Candidatus Moranbacteria bacterium]